MAINNITAPRTMSIETIRPVLGGVTVLLLSISTAVFRILGPVAIVVFNMQYIHLLVDNGLMEKKYCPPALK
jgi:hypothetical protein